MRGVYDIILEGIKTPPGPSPRAWGLLQNHPTEHQPSRSIPTCVGFTWRDALAICSVSVHPHVRGVYFTPEPDGVRVHGPSPRAWGLPVPPLSLRSAQSVHPHVRGVYPNIRSTISSNYGPSPRAWGLLQARRGGCKCSRSIPTCVGFTSHKFQSPLEATVHPHVRGVYSRKTLETRYWTVHPHVRGVYTIKYPRIDSHNGPSPRAWGLLMSA